MRVHYAFNRETGEWFMGSSITSPNELEQFIDRLSLAGFQPVNVDVLDPAWRQIKAAIDNRNNIIQTNYLAELAASGNASVQNVIPNHELVKAAATSMSTGDISDLPGSKVKAGDKSLDLTTAKSLESAIVKAGDDRLSPAQVKAIEEADKQYEVERQKDLEADLKKDAAVHIEKMETDKILSIEERVKAGLKLSAVEKLQAKKLGLID